MPSPLKAPNRPSSLRKAPFLPNNLLPALSLPRVVSRLKAIARPSSLPPELNPLKAPNRPRVASLHKTRQPWENLLVASPPVPARLSAPVPIIAACHPARALLAPAIPCPV